MRLSLLLLLFSPPVFAQTVLEGVVVDAGNHAPVAGAAVAVNVGQAKPILATTDASGHFRVSIAEPKYFNVQVTRNGFLGYSASRPLDGGPPSRLEIEMTRQAVIAGKLEDEDGFPVANATVFTYPAAGGPLRAQGPTATSDDRGQYRIANLPAGKYYVRASSGSLSQWDQRYWPAFYPGTLEPGETGLIELSAGQERSGVDIHFTRNEGVTVAGSFVMPSGVPAPARLMITFTSANFLDQLQIVNVRPGTQSFTIPHVAPGKYSLRAQSGNFRPAAGDWYCEQQIEVGNADVRDIVMSVRAVEPVDLQGTVVTDRGAAPRVIIGLRGNYGPAKSMRTNEDGSFVFNGLLPGTYHVMVSPEISTTAPRSITPVYPISVRLGEKDVMKDGFDLSGAAPPALRITLASAFGMVRGTLLDLSGQPIANGAVVLAPAQGSYRGGTAVSNAKGEFIVGAPVGEYRVYAMAATNQTASLQNPEYLKAHENDFPPVRIVEGDKNPPLMLRLPAAR